MESAYASAKMPGDLAALCAPAQGDGGSWLSDTELGAEVDIVRYWDLLRLADDIDHPALNAPLADTLLPDILARTTADTIIPSSWWVALCGIVAQWRAPWLAEPWRGLATSVALLLVYEALHARIVREARAWRDPYDVLAALEIEQASLTNQARARRLGARVICARAAELDRAVLAGYDNVRAERRV